MRSNINILVSELGPSQLNYYLIRNVNKYQEDDPNSNVQVFTENLSRFCLKPKFGVMSVAEAWGQDGPFIATNVSTAAKMLHYPLTSRRLFYIWDLEFLRGERRIYDIYAPFYLDSSIELICRSKEHADLVENTFNKNVAHIVNNFNMNEFKEILK